MHQPRAVVMPDASEHQTPFKENVDEFRIAISTATQCAG